MGFAVLESRGGGLRHLDHGCVTTSKDEPMGERLLKLHDAVLGLIEKWRPGAGSMESLYFWKNVTSAMPVAEAKGVIRLAFALSGVELAEYSPTAIKQAVTGSARAEKEQVQAMVKLLLRLDSIPKPDHAADAIAAAICRANHSGPF
jgi:crossover junction endodeoxyribonuclease RuvC